LQSSAAQHTALTNLFTGRPARGIVNRVMRELGPMHPAAPAFPLATADMAPLRAAAEAQGSSDFTPLWAGQNAASCRSAAAADITRDFLQAWRVAGASASGHAGVLWPKTNPFLPALNASASHWSLACKARFSGE
jgi:NAD(P)H-dependent flavin oxidoreductase YrpB (nitropropane dioxygenase family)